MEFAVKLRLDLEALPLVGPALEHGLQLVKDTGATMPLIAEFGVFSGTSIRIIKASVPHALVCGFDSFRGLPEDWRSDFRRGHFSNNGGIPFVDDGVVIWKGMFDKTLPQFKELLGTRKIDLLHVDCDLYSSTKTIFDAVHENIRDGTIIVFDELLNYPGYEQHEIKALGEFSRSHPDKTIVPIGMHVGNEQAIIKVM
jgi:hypothetical protein